MTVASALRCCRLHRVSDGADRDQGNLSPGRSMLPSGLSVTPPGLLTVTTSAPARSTISISVFSYVSFIRSFPFHFAGLGWSMVIGSLQSGWAVASLSAFYSTLSGASRGDVLTAVTLAFSPPSTITLGHRGVPPQGQHPAGFQRGRNSYPDQTNSSSSPLKLLAVTTSAPARLTISISGFA